MPVTKRLRGLAAASTLVLFVLASGCSSPGSAHLSAAQLTTKIIPAPSGFEIDTTPGTSGQMSPEQFSQYGGDGPASKAGFVAGFKQNYVNTDTQEGISVTVLEFSSKSKAASYFKTTEYRTLSLAAPTYKPSAKLKGAIEASGTKPYGGNYVHGVADSAGDYYFQVVYADPYTADVPFEFSVWADIQWQLLQPGVSLPPQYTSTSEH
jgi:hypothetical protein